MTTPSTTGKKMSAMLLDVADEYIKQGNNLEEKNNYLRSAITAWNMACVPFTKREKLLRSYVANFRKENPSATQEDANQFERDLRLLIKNKIALYPQTRFQIMNGSIEERDGKEHVTVGFIPKNML